MNRLLPSLFLVGCLFSFLPVMAQGITFNQAPLPEDEVGYVLRMDQEAKVLNV